MVAPSDKLLCACARFGRTPGELRALAAPPDARGLARELDRLLRSGEVGLITGPSGGGKSSILRALARECACVTVPSGAGPTRSSLAPVIDLFRCGPDAALGHLSRAGLADATVLPLTLGELSDGQRFRARLALAMEQVSRPAEGGSCPTLLIDEFASTLDRTTARTLSHLLNRWASRTDIRVVCATAHDDLLQDLRPAVLVYQPLLRTASIARSPWHRASARCASSPHEEVA